ncbi:MAG: diguanylate cyclase, partial [Burkholderiales bacterium]|nr:diguanylate cyclase [Burkholderiales bacterium]
MKTVVTPVRGRTRSRRSEPPDASLFEALVRSASDLITIHDADGITRYESPAASAVLAYPSGFLVGRNPLVIVHPRDAQRAREAFRTLVNEPDAVRIEQLRVRRADRTWARLEVAGRNLLSDPDVRGIVLTSRSMCPTSRAFDTERDHYAATHDPLTGLPNRTLLVDRVEQAIARAQRHRIQVALMRVNLDGFRLVNETLGRGAGDALLRQVAERLRGATRDGDTIARLDADDFVLLLPDLESTGVAAKVADRVLQALSAPFGGRGAERYLSASIGVSVFPDDAVHSDGLLTHAAEALASVKRGGRGAFRFARPQLDGEIRERLVMESTLRQAAERGELLLQYQPKFRLGSRRLAGVEA